MTQPDNSSTPPDALSHPARIAWFLLILATLYICYFHNLGAIGLVGPDEPRYAWIARSMAETGDWVTPRLYGKPWFEKPVLYYWAAAASFKLFGVSEVTARLPSAISAFLATLALAWLALRLYGAETARWLLLLLPTTVGMIGFSHAAATDMPFAGTLTIAMVFAAVLVGVVNEVKDVNEVKEIRKNRPSESFTFFTSSTSFTSLCFGFFLGLAVLAKGPAAIVLSGGAVLFWAIFTKRWRDAFRCFHPLAILSFCATALPWYIRCAHRNPDFFRIFIIEHNFKRYLTPEFQHIQPFWFYVPILLLALFPWTAILIPWTKEILSVFKTRGPEFANTAFFLAWSAFPFLFFTISKSKLPGYILPSVLPSLFFLAQIIPTLLRKRSLSWPLLLVGLSLVALGAAIYVGSLRHTLPTNTDDLPSNEVTLVVDTAAFAGVVVAVLGFLGRRRAALFATLLGALLLVLSADHWLEGVDRELTARTALPEAERYWPNFHIESSAAWNVRRSLLYQLEFYAHSEMKEWAPSEPAPEWIFVEPGRATPRGLSCPPFLVFPKLMACKSTTSPGRP